MSKKRLYTIDTLETHFIFAGHLDDTNQQAFILYSHSETTVLAILFNAQGKILEVRERKCEDTYETIVNTLNYIKREIGLSKYGYIRVQKFWVDGYMIGIHDYPLRLQYLLDELEVTDEQLKLLDLTREELLRPPQDKQKQQEDLEWLERWGEETSEYVLWAGRSWDAYWANDGGTHST